MNVLLEWIATPWPQGLKWLALIAIPLAILGLMAAVANRGLRRRLAELNAQNAQQDNELEQAQLSLARAEEYTLGLQRQLEHEQGELRQLSEKYHALQSAHQQAQTSLALAQETAALNRKHLEEKLALLEENKQKLLNEFDQLSERIYATKAEQNRRGLGEVLTPFKEQLRHLQEKVEQLHLADSKDRAGLKAQIGELHKLNREMTHEAHALATALRGEHKKQGNWGELILERILERSGLRAGEEFQREAVFSEDNTHLRPDVVINLPEGRHLIIDSKVSLNAYTDYVNADVDVARERALKAHIAALRQHITTLSGKAYQQIDGIHSPDFVMMFVPIEPAFMAAFAADERLFDEAFAKKVAVVTPTTLLATLRVVASIWALERRNKSTEQLADEAGKVYDKLALLIERMEKLGKQLNTARNTYDETWHGLTSGQGNLVSTVERFRDVGIRSKKMIAKQISEQARSSDIESD